MLKLEKNKKELRQRRTNWKVISRSLLAVIKRFNIFEPAKMLILIK